jgi:hypothetical protein
VRLLETLEARLGCAVARVGELEVSGFLSLDPRAVRLLVVVTLDLGLVPAPRRPAISYSPPSNAHSPLRRYPPC